MSARLNPALDGRIPRVSEGTTVHVLVEPADHTALGKALVVADGEGAEALHLVVDTGDGVAARRAQGLNMPIRVWRREGTTLVEASPEPIDEQPTPAAPLELVSLLQEAGLDLASEHGVVRGEVLGLEVARISGEPPVLSIGVGVFDQEAFAVINADAPVPASLTRVRDEVLAKRRAGAEPHPFNRLVRERWSRAVAVTDPGTVGCADLAPVPSLIERGGLLDTRPCAAVGHDGAEVVLMMFSSGVDVDLVPTAAELALHHQPHRIAFAVADRDRHPLNQRLVAKLDWPAGWVDPPDL